MQAFHIHYRNTQGTLMRILTAVSRRALEITYVHTEPWLGARQEKDEAYKVTLLLEVNPKQSGQLRRDWFAIMDVTDVRITSAGSVVEHASAWPATGHPPSATRTSDDVARAARA